MQEIATASINSFGIAPKADVPPEDSVFVLTSSQLRGLITQAVQKGIEALQDEVMELKATAASQGEEIAALTATVAEQRADYEGLNDLRCEDFSNLARRLNAHLAKDQEPGKTELTRAEKIEKYLSSRPDHRATYETLKGMLQVDNVRLNESIKILMATSDHSYVIQKEKTGDKRKRSLIMLPR